MMMVELQFQCLPIILMVLTRRLAIKIKWLPTGIWMVVKHQSVGGLTKLPENLKKMAIEESIAIFILF